MKDSEISTIDNERDISIKKQKTKIREYSNFNKLLNIRNSLIFSIIFFLLIIKIQHNYIKNLKKYRYNYQHINQNNNNKKFNSSFKYEDYEKDIITDKIKRYSGWRITLKEAQFINGIIRKNKLKNCLEIGVAEGGSSILILNSIKDMENSILVSLDLNKELFTDKNKLTGYKVNQFFLELSKNWKLYTGDQAHKFLIELNIKFDFLFLGFTHVSPGEIMNFIEALPFLNQNAIVVIHDLFWHFKRVINTKFFPSCISLIQALFGDKIFLKETKEGVPNIAAAFLYPNQKEHYLDYFLLLLNFWEYMPKDSQLNDLKAFVKKYYKDEIYIKIFDIAIRYNKIANKQFARNIIES